MANCHFELWLSRSCEAAGPKPSSFPLPRRLSLWQTTAGCWQAESPYILDFLIIHEANTSFLRPQAGLDVGCVLFFSPRDFIWAKLLISLVALLEAGKFHDSPFKLSMLWGAFAVRSLFDLMCSAQLKHELENICCSRSPRGFHARRFFCPPVQNLDTNTPSFAVTCREKSFGLGCASVCS